MTDYYSEYHQAQQEQTVPNLCPACNGSAYVEWYPMGIDAYWPTGAERTEYDDCEPCHGTGIIDRPYTERDLWLDEMRLDLHLYLMGELR